MKRQLLTLAFVVLTLGWVQAQFTLMEGFEGESMPSGWTTIDAGFNDATWAMDNYSPHSGLGHVSVDCYTSGATNDGRADDWLITPKFMVNEGEMLSVWALSSDDTYMDDLQILISKTGTAEADFTINVASIVEVPAIYTKYSYMLTDIDGLSASDEIYVAFRCNSNGSYLNLDDVMVGPASIKIDEQFEDSIPMGWTVIDGGYNTNTWTDTITGGLDGSNGLWVDAYESGLEMDGRADDWLITPPFSFMGTNVLSFWMYGSDATYHDTVYVALSKTGTNVADFDKFLDTIVTTTEWSKYQYEFSQVSGTYVNNSDEIYVGLWALSNGSRIFLDNFRVGDKTEAAMYTAYAVSANQIMVVYDAEVALDDVDESAFALSGSQDLTFTSKALHPDNKMAVIFETSAPMNADNILDILTDGTKEIEFYAGITPISYTSVTNPNGVIESGYNATFTGIVSATADGRLWLADAEGAYHGINTYDLLADVQPVVGDSILIIGMVDHYKNQSEIYPATLLENIASGKTPCGPTIIAGNNLALTNAADENPAEMYEGLLVQIKEAVVYSYDGAYFLCSDDDGTTNFYVGDRFGILADFGETLFEMGVLYNITGIVTGRDGEYLLAPRDANDIEIADAIRENDSNQITVFPNPFNNNFWISGLKNATNVYLINTLGQVVYSKKLNGETKLNISSIDLMQGIYILTISSEPGITKAIKVIRN